jgi:hypothetical protein
MLKKVILTLLFSSSAFANTDLVLPGERWLAKASGYICQAFGAKVEAPSIHQEMNLRFESISTDRTLDNGLIKATFSENGTLCRYSAILLADNDQSTIKLVKSKAYAPNQNEVECEEGKSILDENLASNNYLYWGHPHHLTILSPVEGSQVICGDSATHVGIDFVVSGRVDR